MRLAIHLAVLAALCSSFVAARYEGTEERLDALPPHALERQVSHTRQAAPGYLRDIANSLSQWRVQKSDGEHVGYQEFKTEVHILGNAEVLNEEGTSAETLSNEATKPKRSGDSVVAFASILFLAVVFL